MVETSKLVKLIAFVAAVGAMSHAVILWVLGNFPKANVTAAPTVWSVIGTGVTVAGLFYLVFERWMWRWSVFQSWLVRFPDLSGNWSACWHSRTCDKKVNAEVKLDHQLKGIRFESGRKG